MERERQDEQQRPQTKAEKLLKSQDPRLNERVIRKQINGLLISFGLKVLELVFKTFKVALC